VGNKKFTPRRGKKTQKKTNRDPWEGGIGLGGVFETARICVRKQGTGPGVGGAKQKPKTFDKQQTNGEKEGW